MLDSKEIQTEMDICDNDSLESDNPPLDEPSDDVVIDSEIEENKDNVPHVL